MVVTSIDAGTVPRNQINEVDRFILKNRALQIIYQNQTNNFISELNKLYIINPSDFLQKCNLPILSPRVMFKLLDEEYYSNAAISSRPDLSILDQIKDIIRLKIEFYENQQLPELDVVLGYEKGVGGAGSPSDTEDQFKAGLNFKYPVFNRKALSSTEIATLELSNRELEINNLLNIIRNEITIQRNNLRTSLQELEIINKEIKLVDELLNADYENFRLGNLDLFQINQRQNILINLKLKANDFFFQALKTKLSLIIFSNQFEEIEPILNSQF